MILRFIKKQSILLLIILTFMAFVGTLKFNYSPVIQFQILTILVLFYLSWALFYHHLDKSLTSEIMVEYLLIVLLATVILYGTLF